MRNSKRIMTAFLSVLLAVMPSISVLGKTIDHPVLAKEKAAEIKGTAIKEAVSALMVEEQSNTYAAGIAVWDGRAAESYAGGSGTSADPYQIQTAGQLAKLAVDTNEKGLSNSTYYVLTGDIYLNDTANYDLWDDVYAPKNSWKPIGTSTATFCGNLDGKGHTIYGVYICSTNDYQGLFGSVDDTARIKGISVKRSYIQGKDHVGGIAGYVYSFGSAPRIADCYNDATVCGTRYVGGIVGQVGSDIYYATKISGCGNGGMITGTDYVGGILGEGFANIVSDSYNTGMIDGETYVGGVSGETYEALCCWNKGRVDGKEYVGGVNGKMAAGGSSTSGKVSSCFNTGNVYGDTYVGGVIGHASAYSWAYTSRIMDCYNMGDVTAAKNYAAGIAGYSDAEVKNCYCACEYYFTGGPNLSQVVTTLKSKSDSSGLFFRTGRSVNNYPNRVTELEESEMLADAFVDTLNNGGSAWKKDTEGINAGYPILAGIDYEKYLPKEIDTTDFNVYIHQAKVMHDPDTDSYKLMGSVMSEKTPSQDFKPFIEGNVVFNLSKGMWDVLKKTSDALDDVTTLADSEPKDIYSAIILNILQDSVSKNIFDPDTEGLFKELNEIISTTNDALKEKIDFDLYHDKFASMTDRQREEASQQIAKEFEHKFPLLNTLGEVEGILSDIFKFTGDIEDALETCVTYIMLSQESAFMKDVLRQVYFESKDTDDKALQAALLDCIEIMDSSMEELIKEVLARGVSALGVKATKHMINKLLWEKVQTKLKEVFPAIFLIQTAYKIGALIGNGLFNTDAILEQCVKVCAVVEVERLIDIAYGKMSDAYRSKKDEASARDYLAAVRVVFSAREQDIKEAVKVPEVIDEALWRKVTHFFGAEDNTAVIEMLKKRQSRYGEIKDAVLLDWIYCLDVYHPGSGLFEKYYRLYRDDIDKVLSKEFIAACPVDVYVYDSQDKVVAYYADGRLHCDRDADLTIIVSGDTKTVRLYDEDLYIRYVGTDAGTMDLTVLDYEDGAVVRTVNYYDIGIKKDIVYTAETNGSVEESSGNVIGCDYDSLAVTSQKAVSVKNGTMLRNAAACVDAYAAKGETIEINAYVPKGDTLLYWRVDKGNVKIKDIHAISTSFIMGDEDVEVTAVMKNAGQNGPDDPDVDPGDNGDKDDPGVKPGGGSGKDDPSSDDSSFSNKGGSYGTGSSEGRDRFAFDLPTVAQTVTGTWIKDKVGWWLRKKDGSYPKAQWAKVDGVIYRFDRNGYMTEGWTHLNDRWYYLTPGSGSLATGWVQIDGKWYYLSADGHMVTGWLYDKAYAGWFYMDPSGAMATGWQLINGKWYYLDPSSDGTKGIMFKDRWVDIYYVDATGAWVEQRKP